MGHDIPSPAAWPPRASASSEIWMNAGLARVTRRLLKRHNIKRRSERNWPVVCRSGASVSSLTLKTFDCVYDCAACVCCLCTHCCSLSANALIVLILHFIVHIAMTMEVYSVPFWPILFSFLFNSSRIVWRHTIYLHFFYISQVIFFFFIKCYILRQFSRFIVPWLSFIYLI